MSSGHKKQIRKENFSFFSYFKSPFNDNLRWFKLVSSRADLGARSLTHKSPWFLEQFSSHVDLSLMHVKVSHRLEWPTSCSELSSTIKTRNKMHSLCRTLTVMCFAGMSFRCGRRKVSLYAEWRTAFLLRTKGK